MVKHSTPPALPPMPSPSKIEQQLRKPGTSVLPGDDRDLLIRQQQAEKQALELKELELKLMLRSRWSRFMMLMVAVMIFFQMLLFVAVGLEWLTFSDQWIARLVLPGTFAEILGFVYIIITYLFPTPKQDVSKTQTNT